MSIECAFCLKSSESHNKIYTCDVCKLRKCSDCILDQSTTLGEDIYKKIPDVMPDVIKSIISAYADDTCLFSKDCPICERCKCERYSYKKSTNLCYSCIDREQICAYDIETNINDNDYRCDIMFEDFKKTAIRR